MKYALRIIRNLRTREVTVQPILKVRDTFYPYSHRSSETGIEENLQIFESGLEALDAEKAERAAAEFSPKTPEELFQILHDSVVELKAKGFPLTLLCRISGISHDAIRSYLYRVNQPNYRVVAKVELLKPLLEEMAQRAHKLLPADGVYVKSLPPRPSKRRSRKSSAPAAR